MKITSKQVAKDLGISEATVSLALNNKPGVSEDTKKKVMDYVQKVKQQKNDSQQSIGKNIKMLIYANERVLYDEEKAKIVSASHIEAFRVAHKSNLNLKLVYMSSKQDVLNAIETSKHDDTEGIILWASEMDEEIFAPFRDISIPLIIGDNEFENMNSDSINMNNRQSIRMAMNYLFAMGHRDILYFHNTDTMYNFRARRKAYEEYVKEKDLVDNTMIDVGTKIETIYENVVEYIKNNEKIPSAILCENYAISIGTIKAFQDCRYKIPDDISIIGIDELPPYVLLDFKFTYIKVLHECKADLIINRLVERISKQPREIVQMFVGNEFVEGNSVRKIN